MKKVRSAWVWLVLGIAVLALFAPAVVASAGDGAVAAKGQYTWLPECLE